MRRVALAVLFPFALWAFASEALAEPWFGLKTPDQLEKRAAADRATYAAPGIAPLSLVSDGKRDPYADIDGADVLAYVEDIVQLTVDARPPGERYWGRIAGSEAEIAAAEYMADRFEAFGLDDVRTEPVVGGAQWWPVEWSVTLLGNSAYGEGTLDLELTSAFPALELGTGEMNVAGLEAELVYVGRGFPIDLRGRDIEGKIALVRAQLQPDPFFQSARGRIEAIVHAGAAGVITYIDGPGNHRYALELLGSPEVPCFVLGGDDGRFLEAVLEAAGDTEQPAVRVDLDARLRPSWNGKNAVGLVRGKTDEYVIVSAHLDGYFESANDNAGGMASALALARHYAARNRRPARNLLFVGTSAHHEFSDGTKAFIAAHPEILEKTVLVFNIEHPSSIGSYYRGPLKLERATVPGQLIVTSSQGNRSLTISNGNGFLLSLYREAIDRYGIVVDAAVGRRPTGDAFDFFLAGIPVVQILDANLWFHSSGDLPDTIHAHGLERATRAYASVLDGIDSASWDELRRKGR